MGRICIKCKDKYANFNIEGEKANYCKNCKTDDMIDVKNKKCIKCNKNQPTYNIKGEKAQYCNDCKTDNMVDVKNKKCIKCNKNQPTYNIEGKKAKYCSNCKNDDMVNIYKQKQLCIKCNKVQACFNYKGETKKLYCSKCKEQDMLDITAKRCLTELCDTIIKNKNYKGYCLRCFIHNFPDNEIVRNYKTKERIVVDYIKTEFIEEKWVSDKKIQGGISNRRPDLMLNYSDYTIIIEIDENQHQKYDCSCENKRLMEISQDLKYKNIIFIRFNPDGYISNNKIIKSCWSVNKNGLYVIDKKKEKEWNERLLILKQQIQYWIENKPDKMIEIIELFYDC
jgi:hypothetical protein